MGEEWISHLDKEDPNPNNGASKPQIPAALQSRDGNIGLAISRPTPVPQWPLAGPLSSPATSEGSEPYRPPAGSSPPQRPPRPSRVPSILDGSRIQDPTPSFQYTPQNPRVSELSVPETPATSSSRDSSVGSIPDFPLPVTTPREPPRRSVNLGPPPSSRRGNSSFYSTASYVSPIPEESPRTRSYASYASSAAIPASFGTTSPGLSHNDEHDFYYDDTIAEESVYSDDADERGLVRSASIGKRGKPSLVTTKSSEKGEVVPIVLPIRPTPKPVQGEQGSPFLDGTGYVDGSSSSSGAASSQAPAVGAALTTDNMLGAFEAASATDPSAVRKATPSPKPFRLSALRRPPRLDIDAVRQAEARGSLTSLPDLIKRATRLAAMMDKGRRPASRFDDLDFPEEMYGRDPEKELSYGQEKHQSGLSDMLAAFPPPAQARSRQSMRQSGASWPLPFAARRSYMGGPSPGDRAMNNDMSPGPNQEKKGRRCCGLPMWGFLLLMFVLLLVIAAAIVVPLEFFVIQRRNNTAGNAQSEVSDCQAQLNCANGGTNVVTDGVCSCICSNGFTGNDCTVSSSQGCTTAALSSTDTTLSNVTLGTAIPRLVQEGQTNFSLPLSATSIISKFNSANLSCVAENALVTFNGQSTRLSSAALTESDVDPALVRAGNAVPVTITILPDVSITLTLENPAATGDLSVIISTLTEPLPTTGSFSTILETTITRSDTAQPTTTTDASATTTTTPTTTSSTAAPTSTFAVSDQVLDFSRVTVLFVLQSQTLENAVTAQSKLQNFFSSTSSSDVTVEQARNVSIGAGNTVDLVNFLVRL
ncbi:uncharacterized protein JN550_001469 [Neoarthrinium moseri]|uniref:uncharacterized protein n=1 Tax=Neoarthrinium moseri TaxID=1658444 RepID=UPI001FDADB58|nr:uncharacterized protein JN550_001469 [Neoarthrinium moseri]KAI1875973.1 hypothetical protein JN550_001469 [Neoarthrinium moseri]